MPAVAATPITSRDTVVWITPQQLQQPFSPVELGSVIDWEWLPMYSKLFGELDVREYRNQMMYLELWYECKE